MWSFHAIQQRGLRRSLPCTWPSRCLSAKCPWTSVFTPRRRLRRRCQEGPSPSSGTRGRLGRPLGTALPDCVSSALRLSSCLTALKGTLRAPPGGCCVPAPALGLSEPQRLRLCDSWAPVRAVRGSGRDHCVIFNLGRGARAWCQPPFFLLPVAPFLEHKRVFLVLSGADTGMGRPSWWAGRRVCLAQGAAVQAAALRLLERPECPRRP